MLQFSLLTPFVVLATRVVRGQTLDTSNLFSIPITKQTNNRGRINIVQNDINRWKFRLKSGPWSPDISLNEQIDSFYMANIGVGTPPQYCEPYQLSLA